MIKFPSFITDVVSNRKLLSMLLNKKSVNVVMAEDGVEAIKILDAHPLTYFDFVFMDNTMPNMVESFLLLFHTFATYDSFHLIY
jgi:CheY-like chemotaxis protein